MYMHAYHTHTRAHSSGLLLCSVLNLLGAALRVLPWPFQEPGGGLGFAFGFLGQTLAAGRRARAASTRVL